MKITALLAKNQPILSFEVFPPKTESGFDSVRAATEEIAALHPAFMSVTYGAGGGTSVYTLDIAENIRARYGVPTLAHLTCVSSTHETVRERIAAIRTRGIENVMALRGDVPPELKDADRSGWDYHYAAELVRELRAAAPDGRVHTNETAYAAGVVGGFFNGLVAAAGRYGENVKPAAGAGQGPGNGVIVPRIAVQNDRNFFRIGHGKLLPAQILRPPEGRAQRFYL